MKKLVMFSIIVIFLISSVTALNQEFTNNKINNNILVNYNRDHRNLMLIELLEEYLTLDINFPEEFIAEYDQEVRITISFNPPGNRVWVLKDLQVVIIPDNPVNNEPITINVPTIKAGGGFTGRRTVTTELNYPEEGVYNPRIYIDYQGARYLDRIYDLEVLPVNSNEVIVKGISYYLETDKYTYRLRDGNPEHVKMLFRVTNLNDEEVMFGFPHVQQFYFAARDEDEDGDEDENFLWYIPTTFQRAMSYLHLQPGESKEFRVSQWNLMDMIDERGRWYQNPNDYIPVEPGRYEVISGLHPNGRYGLGNRLIRVVPVSVFVNVVE